MFAPTKNGQKEKEAEPFEEMGSAGIEAYGGYIQEAYNTRLFWPDVYDIYSRLLRSDPETVISSGHFRSWAGSQTSRYELPTDATPGDQRINIFLNEVIDDIEGGQRPFWETVVDTAFWGWSLFEIVAGVRSPNWSAPDENDPWKSQYSDGLIGVRRLAFRDHSSFDSWELDDKTGRVLGLWQQDSPHPRILLPAERCIHLTFGDPNNPEGLSPLEALWRLERHYFALQLIQGMGFEHSAGHVKFIVKDELDSTAKATIRRAARQVMTAQEGNYITEIEDKFTADIMDISFSSAGDILEAIKYYSTLKLQLFGMQWVALSATTGSGSFAAMEDSSTMALLAYNNMMKSFADRVGQQLWDYLAKANPQLFSQASTKHKLVITPIDKVINLTELAQFTSQIFPLIDVGDEDVLALRRKSGFMPETLPEEVTEVEEIEPDEDNELTAKIDLLMNLVTDMKDSKDKYDLMVAELAAAEKFKYSGPPPIDIAKDKAKPLDDPGEIAQLLADVEAFAKKNGLNLDQFLNAKSTEPVKDDDDDTELSIMERVTGKITELVQSIKPAPVHIHTPQQTTIIEPPMVNIDQPDINLTLPKQDQPEINVIVPEQLPPIVNMPKRGKVTETTTINRDPETELVESTVTTYEEEE